MTKHVLISVLALLAGGIIARFYVAAQSYRPIVQVESPDGVVYTAVLATVHERRACGAASQRFVQSSTVDCPECRIVFARCLREDEDPPAFAPAPDRSRDALRVEMPGVIVRIDAPRETARHTCEWIAERVHTLGVPSARCVAGAASPPNI